MAATKVNLNGINELDLNLNGTTSASTVSGVTTVTNTPAIATSSAVGVVKPDNNTIQVATDGTLSASGAAPSFVQGNYAETGSTGTVGTAISGISSGDSLIIHLRCGNTTAPSITTVSGNTWVLIASVSNSFWGIYTYTYLCQSANPGTENFSFPVTSFGKVIIAEYTPIGGYEAVSNNGVSANSATSSSLTLNGTKNFERALWFFSCSAFSGQTLNQTQRVPSGGSANDILLMDASVPASGTSITGTVTGTMNQAAITGLFFTPLGTVQSVGLTMPSDFTVTGSPITSTGMFQVTGGVTIKGVQQETYTYSSDSGTANSYVISLNPAPTIVAGSEIVFKATNANTGASVVFVNGISYPLTKNGTTSLIGGEIAANQIVTAKYDGANFQITTGGSGGGGGVTSLNSQTGAVTIAGGSNVTVTTSAGTVTIAASGGSSSNSVGSRAVYTSATRVLGTVYHNTSSYPLVVYYYDQAATAPIAFTDSTTTPTSVVAEIQTYSGAANQPLIFLVMPGNYYKITGTTWGGWSEFTFNTGSWSSSGDLSASRVIGTVYQNTGSGAMFVQIMTTNTTATNVLSVVCDSSSTPTQTAFSQQTIVTAGNSIFFVVPPNYYYKVSCTGTPTVAHWYEYSSGIACTATTNLLTAPATRAFSVSSATPPVVYSSFNNSGKTRFLQVGFTNGSTGSLLLQIDSLCPPLLNTIAISAAGGSQIRSASGFHQPNEFASCRQDAGSITGSFWLEYQLG
jgi:hypothetical protein